MSTTRARSTCAILILAFWGTIAATSLARADESRPLPAVDALVGELERRNGLIDLAIDRAGGRLYFVLPPAGPDGTAGRYLYAPGLTAGLGSNPVGLDRGQVGSGRIVRLRRVGRRVLLIRENTGFVARSDDAEERRAVRESFASSVLWAGDVVAEDPGAGFVVDATTLVVRDAHAVAARLKEAEQGDWAVEPERSVLEADACLAFPDNVELEATVTFVGDDPGTEVRAVSPEPRAVTLVVHQSLVRLPDDDYRPRRFDPRCGSLEIRSVDYAAPLDEAVDVRRIVRHRLLARDPDARPLVPVAPIVYYVDRGIPEPVRSAVLDGARWWARAFEAAGWRDAYRVELLPEGAHPLDARYHVIEWVHRATRGWSYGGGIVDPRTGERVKGHVSLGSLRLRQDRVLFEGLVGADRTASGEGDDPIELALARIRQLAAHEVGHTLGFDHNFAASTYDDRASVMDYPAPRVRVRDDGSFDLSNAYGVGVGSWDVQTVRYAYGAWASAATEADALAAIVRDSLDRGLLFLNDADARPIGTAHPRAHLWDNGDDAVVELGDVLEVRRRALVRFDATRVAVGRPLAELEEVLAPLYFHHRYQLEAAVTWIGGIDYRHAVRGDGFDGVRPLGASDQRRALDAVLAVLTPEALDLPEAVVRSIPPRAPGYRRHRETFAGRAAPAFDPLGAAASAAAHALDALLQPERCVRLVDQHRRDRGRPGLEEVLSRTVEHTFAPEPIDSRRVEIARILREETVAALIRLASDPRSPGAVRSRAEDALVGVSDRLVASAGGSRDLARRAHDRWLRDAVDRFLDRRETRPVPPAQAPPAPPGSPIGTSACSRGG